MADPLQHLRGQPKVAAVQPSRPRARPAPRRHCARGPHGPSRPRSGASHGSAAAPPTTARASVMSTRRNTVGAPRRPAAAPPQPGDLPCAAPRACPGHQTPATARLHRAAGVRSTSAPAARCRAPSTPPRRRTPLHPPSLSRARASSLSPWTRDGKKRLAATFLGERAALPAPLRRRQGKGGRWGASGGGG
nr:uncharacterized protein LOC127321197 [Lolium perenne]